MEGNWQISGNFPPFLCFLGPFGGITNQCTTKLMFGMKASFMVTTNNLYSACQNSKKVFLNHPNIHGSVIVLPPGKATIQECQLFLHIVNLVVNSTERFDVQSHYASLVLHTMLANLYNAMATFLEFNLSSSKC